MNESFVVMCRSRYVQYLPYYKVLDTVLAPFHEFAATFTKEAADLVVARIGADALALPDYCQREPQFDLAATTALAIYDKEEELVGTAADRNAAHQRELSADIQRRKGTAA